MALILLVASEPMPLYPHINDYPVTSTCTSSAHYNVVTAALQNVLLQLLVHWTALGNQVSHPACHETAALLTKRRGIPSSLCLQTLPLWDKPLSTPVQHDAKVV